MTTYAIAELEIDLSQLNDAELARHLHELLADPAASPRALCDAIYSYCHRRLASARTDDARMRAAQAFLDALELQEELANGGFDQWVKNGHFDRAVESALAL